MFESLLTIQDARRRRAITLARTLPFSVKDVDHFLATTGLEDDLAGRLLSAFAQAGYSTRNPDMSMLDIVDGVTALQRKHARPSRPF